jgi:tRNA-dihydrouridine synthase A
MRKSDAIDPDFILSVAPMMDWTDRHCRVFHRQLSKQVRLYTEMVVADAIIHGPKDRLLAFDPVEHPVALQLGGSDPDKLERACDLANAYSYDEINLNVGCPSDRVQSGRFGACLMAEPELVAECFKAMERASDAPVTVKCRLGIDDQDLTQTLPNFIETVASAGCKVFIIHARKAWLKGLSPKENRTVPPIDHDLVQAMKAGFPDLKIHVNGQLETVSHALEIGAGLDGAMIGRAAYNNPWILTEIDSAFGGRLFEKNRDAVASDMIAYLQGVQEKDRTAKALIRHMMGLYSGQPGARLWRRTLSEGLISKAPPSAIVKDALAAMQSRQAA